MPDAFGINQYFTYRLHNPIPVKPQLTREQRQEFEDLFTRVFIYGTEERGNNAIQRSQERLRNMGVAPTLIQTFMNRINQLRALTHQFNQGELYDRNNVERFIQAHTNYRQWFINFGIRESVFNSQ